MSWIPCPSCGRKRSVEQIALPEGWSNPKCWFCGDPGWLQPYNATDPLVGRTFHVCKALIGNPILVPAKALHLIDQIIGNEETITADQLGEVRRIILDALNMWHNSNTPIAGCHEEVEIDPSESEA